MTEERAMTAGLIPIRHAALPGVVKLPRRYEKAALGDPRTARYRKVSICSGPLTIGDGMTDRLDDLMTAIMWVKQELILLRQHDILLKRQFFDIHHSIRSLQPKKHLGSSCSSSTSSSILSPASPTSPLHSSLTAINNTSATHSHSASPDIHHQGAPDSNDVTPNSSPLLAGRKRSSSGRLPTSLSDFYMDAFIVRPSSSATLLNSTTKNDNDDEDTDGDDTFDDDYFRPRTSSMRTSRDLAALARRRGSKELI